MSRWSRHESYCCSYFSYPGIIVIIIKRNAKSTWRHIINCRRPFVAASTKSTRWPANIIIKQTATHVLSDTEQQLLFSRRSRTFLTFPPRLLYDGVFRNILRVATYDKKSIQSSYRVGHTRSTQTSRNSESSFQLLRNANARLIIIIYARAVCRIFHVSKISLARRTSWDRQALMARAVCRDSLISRCVGYLH